MVISAIFSVIFNLIILVPFVYLLTNTVIFIGLLVYNEFLNYMETNEFRSTDELDLDWSEILYPNPEYKYIYIAVFVYTALKFTTWAFKMIKEAYRESKHLRRKEKELELSREYNHKRKLLEYKKLDDLDTDLNKPKNNKGMDNNDEDDEDGEEGDMINDSESLLEYVSSLDEDALADDDDIVINSPPKRKKRKVVKKVKQEKSILEMDDEDFEDDSEPEKPKPNRKESKTERMFKEKQERMKREKRRREVELERERQRKETLEQMNRNFKHNKENADKVDVKGVFNRDNK